ncbi:chymotrypsin-1-like [Melitaea cinxia]|uniref:chymotrypsin-1-like n=1 Tax=Melitaea cinxia TaxID=113334 RepID=UPI001E2728B2|nr:chymotrypsin-1-like [Melitaea cinxia]
MIQLKENMSNPLPSQLEDQFYHVDASDRIVGGSVATEGSVPYMAALRVGFLTKWLICGGSIITDRHVLTAAHCIDAVHSDRTFRSLRVVVGTNRWYYGGQTHTVAKMITHENWNSSTVKNDIGFAGGTLSSVLLELIVYTVDGSTCSRAIDEHCDLSGQNIKYEPEIELCAYNTDGRGGDSGGALVLAGGEQVGLLSWGCACGGAPAVFARLGAYREWVRGVLVNE